MGPKKQGTEIIVPIVTIQGRIVYFDEINLYDMLKNQYKIDMTLYM
jgi:hypothetical protein